MSAQQRIVNMDLLLKPRHAPRIEFWRKNENGTCTRIFDGLTITNENYDRLLMDVPQGWRRMRFDS